MNRRQIGLKLALETAGRQLEIDTFDNRLALQKLVYLLKHGGIHLGYSFGWYLRGPYSPSLTEDAFNLVAEQKAGSADLAGWAFDEASARRAQSLAKLWENIPEIRLPRHLELLASVHYVLDNRWLPGDADPATISETLKKYNKEFSPDEVSSALVRLRETGLLSAA
ncbi:MAG: hypothetical protein KDN22_21645 [Verrucomicrobiae bacterium]|nr:hypothetical protein [Verrucomicrobiae bacterium]